MADFTDFEIDEILSNPVIKQCSWLENLASRHIPGTLSKHGIVIELVRAPHVGIS